MAASTPSGIPGQWAQVLDADGAALYQWPRTSEGAANLTQGKVSRNAPGDLVLRTSGQEGNFAGIESPAEYVHGAFEARLCVPSRDGKIANWPAFWLLGDDWPTRGELDAFEGNEGVDYAAYWHGKTVNGPVSGPTTGPSFSGDGYTGTHVPPKCPGLGPGWHTVGISWGPATASVYNDGKLYVTFTRTQDYPMRIIVNNTQGGNGLMPYGHPSDLVVSYVRAWAAA
jgi:beta-glucanase (GH16 family)